MYQDINGNQFDSYEQAVRHYGGDVDCDDHDDFDYDADDALFLSLELMRAEIAESVHRIFSHKANGGNDQDYIQAHKHRITQCERALDTILRLKQAL